MPPLPTFLIKSTLTLVWFSFFNTQFQVAHTLECYFGKARENNALPSGACCCCMELPDEGSEHGRGPDGESGEAGLSECCGDFQCE